MSQTLTTKLRQLPRPCLTHMELKAMLHGSADSRYGKIKRLLAQKKLLHIRRGLYALPEPMPHPFELAQYIYGPSYISLESALNYHGLIPEAVHSITSASSKRNNSFQTPLGTFSYQRLPNKQLFTQVTLIQENRAQFFMATPWKAICDYIYCYKKDWNSLEPLVQSLRIDPEKLPLLKNEDIHTLNEYYCHTRISLFLSSLHKELTRSIAS